jgi:hypothetical protein
MFRQAGLDFRASNRPREYEYEDNQPNNQGIANMRGSRRRLIGGRTSNTKKLFQVVSDESRARTF